MGGILVFSGPAIRIIKGILRFLRGLIATQKTIKAIFKEIPH
jgi:hypothetical protein